MSLLNEAGIVTIYDRFGNLFPLNYKMGKLYQIFSNDKGDEVIHFNGKYYSYVFKEGSIEVQPTIQMAKQIITKQFILKLKNAGYELSHKNYVAYSMQNKIDLPYNDIFSIFDGFEFRIIILNNNLMMCINPHLIVRTNCSLEYLVRSGVSPDKLKDFSVRYREEEGRVDGYLIDTVVDGERCFCKIKNYREFREETVPAGTVFPESKPELIQHLLELLNKNFDLIAKQRELTFLNSKTASKDRFYKTLKIADILKKNIFPITFGDWEVNLETTPIVIKL